MPDRPEVPEESRVEDKALERLYTSHHRRDQSGGERLGQAFLERTRAQLFGSWIGQGKDLLDLGCRDGALTRHFTSGNRVVGVDIDRAALTVAREAHGIEVHCANLNATLPFSDESFDVVMLAETLEHLPYPAITLGEVRRVLRGEGSLSGICLSSITFTEGGGFCVESDWITTRRTASITRMTPYEPCFNSFSCSKAWWH